MLSKPRKPYICTLLIGGPRRQFFSKHILRNIAFTCLIVLRCCTGAMKKITEFSIWQGTSCDCRAIRSLYMLHIFIQCQLLAPVHRSSIVPAMSVCKTITLLASNAAKPYMTVAFSPTRSARELSTNAGLDLARHVL